MNRQAAHRRYMRAVQAHELGYRRRQWSECFVVGAAYALILAGVLFWAWGLFSLGQFVGESVGRWINGGGGW